MDFIPTSYDAHKRIWSGPKKQPFYDVDCSLGKIIFTTMKNYPKNVCQISDDDGITVTNQEMITWAIRIAQRFKKMGLRHDDVIGITAKNTTYLLPICVASFLNCTPFHTVNPIQDEKTIKHLFGLTKPKIIFCDGGMYKKIYSATKSLKPIIYTISEHIEGVSTVKDLLEPTQTELFYRPESLTLGSEQTVAILCSSGTTGLPKAVCISNHQLVFENLLCTNEDIVYTTSSLDWFTGLMFAALCTTVGCTYVISSRPFSPEYYVEMVQKYKPNYTALSPSQVATLLSCPTATAERLQSVRLLIVGGGAMSVSSLERTRNIFQNAHIDFGYGLSEVGAVTGNFGLPYGTSVGKLLPGLSARIVDENGKNLGPNEVGEIYVHNGHKWNGYYGNPLATQRMQDALCWFHTGDLGYFDDKSNLFVVDRKRDTLKYQGMQYWPGEIEQVIMELPDVVDVCVVGVYSERFGDAAGAVVVKKSGSTLTEQTIKEHVAQRLPVFFKQLHAGVQFVDKLPQNENGKVLKMQAKLLFVPQEM